MKKLGVALVSSLFCLSAHADLMITAVYDGPITGGLPKGIELYAFNDIADLSIYGVGSANNGGGTDGEEFTFPAVSLAAGSYIYVATEAVEFGNFFGFAPDYTSSSMSINGDDAIELFRNGELFDLFGDQSTDGTGTPWEYMDGWAYRNSGTSPTPVFNLSDWSFSGPNALDGESQNNIDTLIPVGSFGGACGDCNPTPTPTPTPTPIASVLISSIQGTPDTQQTNMYGETDVSPLIGETVVVEAVVVGDFQDNDGDNSRNLDGFYLQEESSDEDGDPLSSEGIFVYDPATLVDVNVGDLVKVTATVDQYFGETQLSDVSAIEIISSDQLNAVTPAQISLLSNTAVSISGADNYQADLEAYEGMLVSLAESVQITEQYQLDRFNEIRVTAGERPAQFTQLNSPDALLYDLWMRDIAARTVVYDDGLNVQNALIDNLDGFAPYIEDTAPRMGDTAQQLTGVLDYKWAGNASSQSTWRIRSHIDGTNTFEPSNPRPLSAPEITGNLKVTSFNVLNLFTTLDNGGSTALGHDPRGADNAFEFERQLQKTVNAIIELDADVLGLVELENEFDSVNDGSTAVEALVNAVNSQLGSDVYAYVYPGDQFVGSDAIAVGVIYKTNAVAPAANSYPAILDDSVAATLPEFAGRDFDTDPLFNGEATNRASLAVSFEHLATGDTFTIAVNHFKSKGQSGLEDTASTNFDLQNGAGFWNQRRLEAAQALTAWLATAPTGISDDDIFVVGDLNSYVAEDPVQYLLANGFNNVENADAYSFVFDGQVGTLDYVLLSDSLMEKLTNAEIWHVNSDEADALDYNTDFGRSTAYFNATTATRNSDHDPLLVGLMMEIHVDTLPELIDLYNELLADGSISGTGKFPIVQAVRAAHFEKLLARSERFFEKQQTALGCIFLLFADKYSDGENWPKDLITGEKTALLNQQILTVSDAMGCNG